MAVGKKRKGPKPLSSGSPLVPAVPAVSPAAVVIVPVVPAVPVSPAMVPTPTAIIMRMVVTVAVAITVSVGRLVPTVAPCVADVRGLLNVGSSRGMRRNADRHRRRSCAGECHAAQRGEANKCRSKFHDIHLLTSVGGARRAIGSAHYCELTSMNKSRAFQFVIVASRTARSWHPTNLHADGGFDAD